MEIRSHLLKVNEGRNFCSKYRTSLFLFVQHLSEPYTLHVNGSEGIKAIGLIALCFCLSTSKAAKFESDLLKPNENIAPQSREILQTFV